MITQAIYREKLLYSSQNTQMRVLYIEDDIVDQKILKRMSKRITTMTLEMASSLKEALVKCQSVNYDLIISDFYIAGDTAEDVLSKFQNLPVAVVSGVEDKKIVHQLYELGAFQVITKPVGREALKGLIEKVTESLVNK